MQIFPRLAQGDCFCRNVRASTSNNHIKDSMPLPWPTIAHNASSVCPSHAPAGASDDTVDIYARIAARRNSRPLIPLDPSLLHSPPVADGWNGFLSAIRSRTVIDPGLLELASNDGWRAIGVKAQSADAATTGRAALRGVGFDDREIVELTTGIAGYNCVSRFLVTLDVGENNGRKMKSVEELVAELD
ncbi:hypothetical protein N7492_002505 [Penicillium capsulatum]|uniref:Uncharacterized protein n=1 Tax=Penicillium capsulatum TaxID=69766 RepID=A0A9W9ILL9_9EURO|nr:hypothetical protein N7492_002505 [Penicillium capsulatum]KAJ6122891.1 hypothetical protein N7512_005356 [Penicillium capsulatum]